MNEPSIFTRIINGEIPCHKVYEDDKTLAFLDIHPIQPGHVLVIPKRQVEFVWDLDEEDYEALFVATKKIALHLRQVTGAKYIGSKIIGADVPHAHIHLIPFNISSEYNHKADLDTDPDHAELASVAEKLRIN